MASGSARVETDNIEDPSIVLRGPLLILAITVLAMVNFMAILDMTIVNVAVPHIAGSLAVAPNEGTWSITSYAVAEAIMVPLTGWLAQRFGAVRVLTISILGFGLFSALCGISTSLGMLVTARVLQGLCGGPLMPMSQTILMRVTPKRSTNQALGLWMMTTIIAPVVGPILGGTITDGPGWPWAFYINVPISIGCALLCWKLLASRETVIAKAPVDYVGFFLLAVWVGALQIMLDNGQDDDWFASPFIVALCVVSILGFVAFLIWELTDEHPIVDLRIFRHGGFAVACVAMTFVFGGFFASIVLIPLWLQTNMGYTATWSGNVIAFNGVLGVAMAPMVAMLVSRIDARALMSLGLAVVAATTLYRGGFAQSITYWQMVPVQLAFGCGMPLFFIPLMAVTMASVTEGEIANAAGITSFLRSMSGSFSAAIVITVWSDGATRSRVDLIGRIHEPAAALAKLAGGGHDVRLAQRLFDNLIESQSVMLSTNHMFQYIGVVIAAVAAGVWLLPKTKVGASLVAGH